jgi:hypothetical protein
MLAQVVEGGVGVEVALEVSVVAVGDDVGVAALGACALGDGFACGGDGFGACEVLVSAVGFGSCGVEGCGADEVLEVVSAHALYFRHSGQPQGLPLRRRGDTNLVGAGLVPARFACCNHIAKTLIPIARPRFSNFRGCRIPPLPALSPLDKGGEGWGEGGFESCAFTNFGSAVGITMGGGILPACENPLPCAPNERGWCTLVRSDTPHPNPPRTRGGSRDSSPVYGEVRRGAYHYYGPLAP